MESQRRLGGAQTAERQGVGRTTMFLVIGTALGFLLAGSAFLVARGFVGLFRRRWKVSVLRLLGGAAVFAVTVLLLVVASSLRIGATADTEKARVLAGNISMLMNLSFLGIPFGALVGLVAELRARRPPNKPLQQPGSPP